MFLDILSYDIVDDNFGIKNGFNNLGGLMVIIYIIFLLQIFSQLYFCLQKLSGCFWLARNVTADSDRNFKFLAKRLYAVLIHSNRLSATYDLIDSVTRKGPWARSSTC